MSKYSYIFLSGHSGMAFGHYLTAGKQSPEVPPGIYEGQFNREVVRSIVRFADNTGFSVEMLGTGPYNIPQTERVDIVNRIHELTNKKCILVVIHANAAREPGWSASRGFAVYHSRNASVRSKCLARLTEKHMRAGIESPSRGVKIAGHTITTKTKPPAILVECPFMTNKTDAAYMASERGVSEISNAIWEAVVEFDALHN